MYLRDGSKLAWDQTTALCRCWMLQQGKLSTRSRAVMFSRDLEQANSRRYSLRYTNLAYDNSAYYNSACYNLAYDNSACYNSACYNLPCYNLAYYNMVCYNLACYNMAYYNLACYNLACYCFGGRPRHLHSSLYFFEIFSVKRVAKGKGKIHSCVGKCTLKHQRLMSLRWTRL